MVSVIARLPRSAIELACFVATVLLPAFWGTWFIHRDLLASEHRSEYFTFENAFPLADGWLALCCAAGLVTLRRRKPLALLWLVAAGSASAFLTAMDVLYDVENDVYGKGGPACVELLINGLTAALAVVTMTWAGAHSEEILRGRTVITA